MRNYQVQNEKATQPTVNVSEIYVLSSVECATKFLKNPPNNAAPLNRFSFCVQILFTATLVSRVDNDEPWKKFLVPQPQLATHSSLSLLVISCCAHLTVFSHSMMACHVLSVSFLFKLLSVYIPD